MGRRMGGKGNEGVSAFLQRVPGAIGYVEYAYAKQNKLSHVLMQNADGQFVAPGDRIFKAAAAGANGQRLLRDPHERGRQGRVADHRGDVHHDAQGAGQAGEGRGVIKFFDWAYKSGGKMAEELDYVPLPTTSER